MESEVRMRLRHIGVETKERVTLLDVLVYLFLVDVS